MATIKMPSAFILCAILLTQCFASPDNIRAFLSKIGLALDTEELERNGIDLKDIISKKGVATIRLGKLYSRNSLKFVRISRTYIDGRGQREDKDAKLRFESTDFGSQIRVKSTHCDCYLCVSYKGNVISLPAAQALTRDGCVFIQGEKKGYSNFRTKLNTKWYLGITNDGGLKLAWKTHPDARAARFLVS